MDLFNQDIVAQIEAEQPAQDLFSIKDFLRWTYSIFNRADIYYGQGYDNSWDEAQQLVLTCLDLPYDFPEQFYDSKLTTSEKQSIIDLVIQRIAHRTPLAYLIQHAWFCGLPFYVDERVIIPRSPINALIQEKFSPLLSKAPQRILDLCTGSGCIAIACADAFPEAEVDAVDLSIDALNVAEINIEQHNLSHRVFPIHSDLFSAIADEKYDLIVTNPPYVDLEDLHSMPSEFHHEPEMALGSGDDGLTITKQILTQAANHLTDNGVLVCEVGNSMVHLIAQYPEVPFQWLELKNGGCGVFALTKKDLEALNKI